MDQFNNLEQYSLYMIPWVTLLAGLTGSVHCIGMCGGLVAASTHTKYDNFLYQLGRLAGYLLVAFLISLLKVPFSRFVYDREFSLMVAISIGLSFVYLGIKQWKKQKSEVVVPGLFKQIQQRIFRTGFALKNLQLKAILIGFSSIFLPCGFLYAMLFSVIGLMNTTVAMFSIFSFWLGTLPALTFAPLLIKKYFSGLSHKYPRVISGTLISFGLLTIIWRVVHFYGNQASCH